MRVGNGYDIHVFAEGRKLILGTIEVPHRVGLDGHTDADVVLHAIADALLGAIAAGDIGDIVHADLEKYKGAPSSLLVEEALSRVKAHGFSVSNLDVTIIGQKPNLKPFMPKMKAAIAALLGITEQDVSVKGTTAEGLGFIGREEGMAASATVLLTDSV